MDAIANDFVEQESTGSIPSPIFSGTNLNKRLRSKVWDDFIPTFVDGKVARAKCMHCHQVFGGTNGTSSLLRHLSSCIPATQKRPRMQEHTSLPSTHKGTVSAVSDPKQKKLSFLPSNQKKCAATGDMTPVQKVLALPDTPTNMTKKLIRMDLMRTLQSRKILPYLEFALITIGGINLTRKTHWLSRSASLLT